jgi:anti-sigma B factor antagonist
MSGGARTPDRPRLRISASGRGLTVAKLKIDTEFTGHRRVVVHLTGDIDIASAGLLESALRALQMDGRPSVILDLAGVEFLDSTALGVLVRAHRRAVDTGGTLLIRGAIRLFQLTGLDREIAAEAAYANPARSA